MTTRNEIEALDANIGRRIREIREAQHMPLIHVSMVMTAKFGFQTWKHATTPAKVEYGERALRLSEAVALASILGVPLTDLIDETAATGRGRNAAIRELRLMRNQVDKRITELQES